jgi:PIN domain nuclease of toxin-antitoxin system
MRLLLDTHIFLWYISGNSLLPGVFRDVISDPANEAYLSVASVWEAVIKYRRLRRSTSLGSAWLT